MCGISGIIGRDGVTPEDLARVSAMSRALVHRGPDDSGVYSAPHVALASRRLSIIDLTGGRQPLYNEDRSLALVANGEIYNHAELRRRLEGRGHRFTTGSDCETILHAYAEYGTACVEHLRGMFAFALWDGARRRLVLARDPMGEKPLYLYERDGRLLFASEMKALLRSGEIPFELDARSVDLYFHYQYVPEPLTAVEGVRKLDAAHLLVVDVEPWRVAESCYWRMEDAPPLEGDAPALIREQLEAVGALITRADTPVGVALSGGLDSSAVAAVAARHRPGELHAFCVGYPGRPEGLDERDEAHALARHLGLPFHEVEVETEEVVEFFPELNYLRDDPVADYSGHAYYAVMRKAREQGVPVMLQGQGGDELFWGYPQLRRAAVESFEKEKLRGGGLIAPLRYLAPSAPASLSRAGLSAWARDLGGARSGWRRMREHRASPGGRLVFYDISPDYRAAAEAAGPLYSESFAEQLDQDGAGLLFTLPLPWPRVDVTLTRLISDTYLRANGVAQGDRLAMASSVELRLPLLDRRLVETVVGLRKTRTDVRLPPKAWLKSAVEGLLPEWVLKRPKRGFAPPVGEWHRALFDAYGDSLRGGYLVQSGVLNTEGAGVLARGPFPEGLTSPLSFKALVLEQWCRRMGAQSRVREAAAVSHESAREFLESVS
ncbi:MAG: asparagine synthase (glutamine-hydrolyzing) [Acidobacteria bacterium]|nr:asparagine synthase (glutamine-hydrolyzing) [Acidobacteriota bacterium]MCA1619913.1 asparagine synthase (glutamine-hydrolyzing) [Acidobacteriota bacterium]